MSLSAHKTEPMTIKQLDNPTPTQTPMRFTFRPQLQMIFWFKIPPPQILPSFFYYQMFFSFDRGNHENVKNLAQNLAYAYALHCWRPRDIFQFSIFDLRVDMAVYIFKCKKFAFLLFKFKVPLKFLSPSIICGDDLEMTLRST